MPREPGRWSARKPPSRRRIPDARCHSRRPPAYSFPGSAAHRPCRRSLRRSRRTSRRARRPALRTHPMCRPDRSACRPGTSPPPRCPPGPRSTHRSRRRDCTHPPSEDRWARRPHHRPRARALSPPLFPRPCHSRRQRQACRWGWRAWVDPSLLAAERQDRLPGPWPGRSRR